MTIIVLAALIENDRVFMARRAAHKQAYPELWDLVGGHVETGESFEIALIREVREEVGVTPITFRPLGSFEDSQRKIAYHLYAVTDWSDGPPRLIGDEHTDFKWVPIINTGTVAPLAHPEIWSFLALARPERATS
ncbi:NUDIX domain-containing protein [Rhizobium sp. BR 315]|uniref:NUDIX domain-containing protein n=1 Tax=Rhizobium sp. BR 315 TaxID=3040014 RepID=UPI003D33FD41